MSKCVIAIDVDDVLLHCSDLALKLAHIRYGIEGDYEETKWCFTNLSERDQKCVMGIFQEEGFYASQTPLPGATMFLRDLLEDGNDVVCAIAPYGHKATLRIEQIHRIFPVIPENNIIVTNRKDLIACDVMLDDQLEHILSSRAKLRLLKTRPWNKHERDTGAFVRYDTFDEALEHINQYKTILL